MTLIKTDFVCIDIYKLIHEGPQKFEKYAKLFFKTVDLVNGVAILLNVYKHLLKV